MNGSEQKYSREYVEIQTSLEHIRTKIGDMESILRGMNESSVRLNAEVNRHRSDIAGIKATAAVAGGLAGSVIAFLAKFLVPS